MPKLLRAGDTKLDTAPGASNFLSHTKARIEI
jgi:hypothetical protein